MTEVVAGTFDVFRMLIKSLVSWFCTGALGLVLFKILWKFDFQIYSGGLDGGSGQHEELHAAGSAQRCGDGGPLSQGPCLQQSYGSTAWSLRHGHYFQVCSTWLPSLPLGCAFVSPCSSIWRLSGSISPPSLPLGCAFVSPCSSIWRLSGSISPPSLPLGCAFLSSCSSIWRLSGSISPPSLPLGCAFVSPCSSIWRLSGSISPPSLPLGCAFVSPCSSIRRLSGSILFCCGLCCFLVFYKSLLGKARVFTAAVGADYQVLQFGWWCLRYGHFLIMMNMKVSTTQLALE